MKSSTKALIFSTSLLITLTISCKEEDDPIILPNLATLGANNITSSSANSGGLISDNGGGDISERGVCWNIEPNPTIEKASKSIDGLGIGSYTSTLEQLISGTKYYVRAYATNEAGTAYGNEISFTTTNSNAEISTATISSITYESAICGGNVSHDGGAVITSKGVCWGTSQDPVIESDLFSNDGSGKGEFTSEIINLEPGTIYYIRSYAINEVGISYGNQLNFETLKTTPTLKTTDAGSITSSSAIVTGSITSNGGDMILESGLCYSTSTEPDMNDSKLISENGQANFSIKIDQLVLGTTYYVRAFATNSVGTSFGNEISFTTHNNPQITTISPSDITKFSFTSGGNITNDGGSSVINSGICWDTNPNPTIELNTKTINSTSIGNFSNTIHALVPSTTYYLRAYATNTVGTSYGEELTITTNTTDVGLQVGQEYAGGIIIYLDNTFEHGIVVTTQDQTSVEWGCRNQFISGTSSSVGTGQQNTNAILNQCNSSVSAAKICDDLVFNRYEDWYLPSKDELNLIYTELYLNNIGGFNNIYRSSTENDGNSVWTQQFIDGQQYTLWKGSQVGIRAVRSF